MWFKGLDNDLKIKSALNQNLRQHCSPKSSMYYSKLRIEIVTGLKKGI